MTASPHPFRDGIFQDATDLAAMAEALGRSADYRVLRRLVPRTEFASTNGQATKTGILLDTETAGLDHGKDEIIELGMVKFDYLPDGRIAGVSRTFSAFNEPSIPIPPEITAITGITDEMVAGHRIDEAAVNAFVDDAVIVVAHNAGFDRKFSELFASLLEAGFEVGAGDLGENITTAGLDLERMPLGSLIELGRTTIIELTGLRTPCVLIDRLRAGLKRQVLSSAETGPPFKSGVLGVVRAGCAVAAGEAARVRLPSSSLRALPAL